MVEAPLQELAPVVSKKPPASTIALASPARFFNLPPSWLAGWLRVGGTTVLVKRSCCPLACDKMCEVSQMFRYRLDYGSVILITDDGTHFGFDVGLF